jgi:hypothetical protein
MPKKRITQDAQLLLQLDLLRNEAEMRKARLWWRDEFWPETAAGYLKIEMAQGTEESAWLRQVATYWGMAASLVLDDTLKEKTFFEPAFSQELFTVFSKVRPFLKELRQRTNNADYLANVEKVIFQSKGARKRLQREAKSLASLRRNRA